jgi:hypothetical protein
MLSTKIISQHPHAGIKILSDFNALNDKLIRAYPLKQVVQLPTRGKTLLDKIYPNISDWYQVPYTVPRIATTDHCGVV